MSRFAILAAVDQRRMEVLKRLRADHYRYLLAHQERLVFGGPARSPETGLPETMIIIVEVDAQSDAEAFIAAEPYNQHGCFSRVDVRPWSQVMPEAEPGALARVVAEMTGPSP